MGVALFACGAPTEETLEPVDKSIESTAAGIRIVTLPDPFVVEANDDNGLLLRTPTLPGSGSVLITMSDVYPTGLNIIKVVTEELSNFEALPEGTSFGQNQLIAPIGTVYVARGRYLSGETQIEELKAMLAHPWGNRLLTLAYTYPATEDTAERPGHLMDLLGEVEPLDQPAVDSP
jgi:hypothetical protein